MAHLSDEQFAQCLEEVRSPAGDSGAFDSEVMAHLDGCAECRDLLEGYRSFYGQLQEQEQTIGDEQFVRAVTSRLSPSVRHSSGSVIEWLFGWLPQGVGGMVAVSLLIFQLGEIRSLPLENDQERFQKFRVN